MNKNWISNRLKAIDASGIRKVFDLAANMKKPINLSIGQPHFDTPEPVKTAFKKAIDRGKNTYAQTQGIAPLLQRLQANIDAQYQHSDRGVFVTSGTSGGLMLALCTLVNPGDEVIIFNPWFVMYKHLITLAGGTAVEIDTYPDFKIDIAKVEKAITEKTKVIICNTPSNPTGAVGTEEEMKGLAELAKKHDIALISDEIYESFTYDKPFVSPAKWNDETIVINGFSKSHSMTGHRCGYCHGPKELMQQMAKLQQFTFVCSPHPVQYAALAALDYDISSRVADYKSKRDLMLKELEDFEIHGAGGAFYLFIKAPWGTGTEFVTEAINHNLLIIPGSVFSPQDTHFRISYATKEETLKRGADVLRKIAKR